MITAVARSPDRDTDVFDIVTGVLQGDTLESFLFILNLDYIHRTSIDLNKWFLAEKCKKLMIFCKIYDIWSIRRWPDTSHKHISPSEIPIAYWSQSEYTENSEHVFWTSRAN